MDDGKVESFVHDESHKRCDYNYQHPEFRVLLACKFELSEPCEVFFNRWVKYFYLLIVKLFAFSLLGAWQLLWALLGPPTYLLTSVFFSMQCSYDAFNNLLIPHGADLEGFQLAY